MLCKFCDKELIIKRDKTKKFCDKSCSMKYRKLNTTCQNCGIPTDKKTWCEQCCEILTERKCKVCDNMLTLTQLKYCSDRCNKTDFGRRRRKIYRQTKIEVMKQIGGKCSICGYNRNAASLCFHHLDSSKKDFNIGSQNQNYFNGKMREEIAKCQLLCHNCHFELHHPHLNGVFDEVSEVSS